ncbi:unnamed protein product [Orchesella dallaii]|uniref:Uncharacterized protein n=1 Tax=Orchesella dallaii TaxID=48710 RepID=A0ABP1R2X1_9HEXA
MDEIGLILVMVGGLVTLAIVILCQQCREVQSLVTFNNDVMAGAALAGECGYAGCDGCGADCGCGADGGCGGDGGGGDGGGGDGGGGDGGVCF